MLQSCYALKYFVIHAKYLFKQGLKGIMRVYIILFYLNFNLYKIMGPTEQAHYNHNINITCK